MDVKKTIKINQGDVQLSVLEAGSRSVFQVTNRGHHNRNTAERVVAWKVYRQEGPQAASRGGCG